MGARQRNYWSKFFFLYTCRWPWRLYKSIIENKLGLYVVLTQFVGLAKISGLAKIVVADFQGLSHSLSVPVQLCLGWLEKWHILKVSPISTIKFLINRSLDRKTLKQQSAWPIVRWSNVLTSRIVFPFFNFEMLSSERRSGTISEKDRIFQRPVLFV